MDAAIPNNGHDIKHEGDDQDSSEVLISSSKFKFTEFPNLTSFTGVPWSVLRLVCVCLCSCVLCVGLWEWGGLGSVLALILNTHMLSMIDMLHILTRDYWIRWILVNK